MRGQAGKTTERSVKTMTYPWIKTMGSRLWGMHISQLSHTNVPLPNFLPVARLTKGLLLALHHSPQSVSESWHWERARCERGSALCSWLKTRIRSLRNLSLFDRGGVLCGRKALFVKRKRHPVSTCITLIRVDSQYHSGLFPPLWWCWIVKVLGQSHCGDYITYNKHVLFLFQSCLTN